MKTYRVLEDVLRLGMKQCARHVEVCVSVSCLFEVRTFNALYRRCVRWLLAYRSAYTAVTG